MVKVDVQDAFALVVAAQNHHQNDSRHQAYFGYLAGIAALTCCLQNRIYALSTARDRANERKSAKDILTLMAMCVEQCGTFIDDAGARPSDEKFSPPLSRSSHFERQCSSETSAGEASPSRHESRPSLPIKGSPELTRAGSWTPRREGKESVARSASLPAVSPSSLLQTSQELANAERQLLREKSRYAFYASDKGSQRLSLLRRSWENTTLAKNRRDMLRKRHDELSRERSQRPKAQQAHEEMMDFMARAGCSIDSVLSPELLKLCDHPLNKTAGEIQRKIEGKISTSRQSAGSTLDSETIEAEVAAAVEMWKSQMSVILTKASSLPPVDELELLICDYLYCEGLVRALKATYRLTKASLHQKFIRKLKVVNDCQPEDFGVTLVMDVASFPKWTTVKAGLRRVNQVRTPHAKLQALVECSHHLCACANELFGFDEESLSTENLVGLFMFLVAQTQPYELVEDVYMMSGGMPDQFALGEEAFSLATVETALLRIVAFNE